jgi:hypothetical protein
MKNCIEAPISSFLADFPPLKACGAPARAAFSLFALPLETGASQ